MWLWVLSAALGRTKTFLVYISRHYPISPRYSFWPFLLYHVRFLYPGAWGLDEDSCKAQPRTMQRSGQSIQREGDLPNGFALLPSLFTMDKPVVAFISSRVYSYRFVDVEDGVWLMMGKVTLPLPPPPPTNIISHGLIPSIEHGMNRMRGYKMQTETWIAAWVELDYRLCSSMHVQMLATHPDWQQTTRSRNRSKLLE